MIIKKKLNRTIKYQINNNTRPEDPVQIKNDAENKEEVEGY